MKEKKRKKKENVKSLYESKYKSVCWERGENGREMW
jgi:hypothetical protein